ncbi:MAG TPA: ABC transporter permease subunit [Actinomycetota bacterium]|jgi:Cu-processing system permease protein|nr:ABC transporter permease subunit [Actinomycetota bacterium]
MSAAPSVIERPLGRGHGVTALAAWELKAAVRSRWVLGTAIVFAAISLGVTLLGLEALRGLGLSGVGPASAGLVNLGVLLPPLMGLLLGAGSIAGARERGLLAMMVAQPVSRTSLIVGVFLGLVAALWITVAAGFGLSALVLAGVARVSDLAPFGALVVATLAVGTAGLGVGIGLSSVAAGRTQAVALAVAVWFVLALGMDLALAGLGPAVQLGPEGLLVAVLLNPLEAGRILALLAANPSGAALGPFGTYMIERFGSTGSAVLLGSAIAAWTVIPLLVARSALRRRPT